MFLFIIKCILIKIILKAPPLLYGMGASGSTFYPGSLASLLQQSKLTT